MNHSTRNNNLALQVKDQSIPYSPMKSFGMLSLYVFVLLRPITVAFPTFGSVSTLDIFGIGVSFLMLMGLLLNMRGIKFSFVFLIMLFFSFYCFLSFIWGSEYRDVVRMTLPFIPFFLISAVVKDLRDIKRLLVFLILGYVVPIIGSVFLIVTGRSETMETGSMVERQFGLSSGPHTLAHFMLFFSFIFGLYFLLSETPRNIMQKISEQDLKESGWHPNELPQGHNHTNNLFGKVFLTLLLIGSFFCVYKSFTRTVYLGAILFWLSYLWFWNKKWFLIFFTAGLILITLHYENVENIFWQKEYNALHTSHNLNTATSGRLSIWSHNLKLYSELPLTTQLLGVGLGNELKKLPESYKIWAGSHNDYLSMIIMLGSIGLSLYLLLYLFIFIKILGVHTQKRIRWFFLTMLLCVILMNFLSNSYIVRFQMAQLFWFIIGILYSLSHINLPAVTRSEFSALPIRRYN